MRNIKKMLMLLTVAFTFIIPLNVSAHTHEFGSSSFYGVEYLKENPFSSSCAVAYTYHVKTCNICGYNNVFIYSSQQMNHNYVNNKCSYCGMVRTRRN